MNQILNTNLQEIIHNTDTSIQKKDLILEKNRTKK